MRALNIEAGHCTRCRFTGVLPYLRDQQLNVLFKAVQESLQGAGVGGAALSSLNLWQSSMLVLDLRQNLEKTRQNNTTKKNKNKEVLNVYKYLSGIHKAKRLSLL